MRFYNQEQGQGVSKRYKSKATDHELVTLLVIRIETRKYLLTIGSARHYQLLGGTFFF